jgi:hypothetical protein
VLIRVLVLTYQKGERDMENITVLRATFQEALKIYASSSGPTAAYYEGKIAGMVDAAAAMMNIHWIEADVMLRKSE